MATLVTQELNVTVHYADGGEGWVMATIPEVPGAVGQGRTRRNARKNVIEALRLILTADSQLAGHRMSSDDELLKLVIK